MLTIERRGPTRERRKSILLMVLIIFTVVLSLIILNMFTRPDVLTYTVALILLFFAVYFLIDMMREQTAAVVSIYRDRVVSGDNRNVFFRIPFSSDVLADVSLTYKWRPSLEEGSNPEVPGNGMDGVDHLPKLDGISFRLLNDTVSVSEAGGWDIEDMDVLWHHFISRVEGYGMLKGDTLESYLRF